jgi:hypothetical protein
MALSESQEEVLFLIGHGEGRCVPDALREVLAALSGAGLADIDTEGDWVLTAAGQGELDRLIGD